MNPDQRKPGKCYYTGEEGRCYHSCNDSGMCSDNKYCLVALMREAAGARDINPCGKRCKDMPLGFKGCGSVYCIHVKGEE